MTTVDGKKEKVTLNIVRLHATTTTAASMTDLIVKNEVVVDLLIFTAEAI